MQERLHQNNFDFMRLIGACTVIVYHSYPLHFEKYYHDWLYDLTGYCSTGSISLDVFFVISGYLITQSFIRRPNFVDFFKARILRIFPALIVAMMLSVFLLGSIFTKATLSDYFSNAYTWRYFVSVSLFKMQFNLPQVFSENYHHTNSINGSIWSLSYEFTMYIFLFFLGVVGLLKPTTINIIIHALLIAIMVYLDMHPDLTTKTFFGIQTTRIVHLYSLFMMGSWLFILKDKIKIDYKIALLVLLIWIGSFHTKYCAWIAVFAVPVLTIWFAYLPIGIFKKITASGDYSYGIYVFGFPIQQIIIHCTKGTLGIYPLIFWSLFFSITVAILSYHFIEKRALKWK